LSPRRHLRILAFAACLAAPGSAFAGGVVTACASDTQTGAGLNLTNALASGGTVTFACKAGATIEILQSHTVSGTVVVDGAVTLKSQSYHAMFLVPGDLTFRGVTLINPYVGLKTSTGPSGIATGPGSLTLINSRVTGSVNPFYVETVEIQHSVFENNPTFVLITAGIVVISDSDFTNNAGAIVLRSNRPAGSGRTTVASIENSRFRNNGLPIQWTGRLTLKKSEFHNNGIARNSGGAVRLSGQGIVDHTLFDGNTAAEGGAIWLDGGTLSLERAIFRNNTAQRDGGAIGVGERAEGSIISRYGTFTANKAARGGAIKLAWSGATIALQGGPNTFARNTANLGGAIFSELGRIQLQRGVFVENTAATEGGAIYASRRGPDWAAVLANSLVVRNTAPDASAISGSALTLINSTIAGNSGLAIGLRPLSHFAPAGARPALELRNAVIANNAGGNCAKPPPGLALSGNGHNLQFPGAQCGGMAVGDPLLSPLYEPGTGSPALTGGENTICANTPISARDVYGASRPQGAACSIGAVEGDVDPRLFQKLLSRLGDRIRHNLSVLASSLR
jgi:predicted outer membrane repeat protein